MKELMIFIIASFLTVGLYSQKLGFTTISPLAGSFDNGEVSFYFSLGEPLNLVSEGGEVSFSQGLLNIGSSPSTVSTVDVDGISITLFPNPSNDLIQFKTDLNMEKLSCYIQNTEGRKVLYKPSLAKGEIRISHLPAGIYYLTLLQSHETMGTIKVVKN